MTGTEIVLDILDYIMTEKVANFNKLKSVFAVNQSTLSRHLKLLCEKEFLTKNNEGQYCLGEKLERFHGNLESECFFSIMDEATLELSRKNNVTTLYFDFSFGKMICKSKHMADQGVLMQRVGTVRFNYAYNPWGIIFLNENRKQMSNLIKIQMSIKGNEKVASLTEEEINVMFKRLNKDGYLDDKGQIFKNLRRIAVPIEDNIGQVKGALVSGFIDGSLEKLDVDLIIRNMLIKAEELKNLI